MESRTERTGGGTSDEFSSLLQTILAFRAANKKNSLLEIRSQLALAVDLRFCPHEARAESSSGELGEGEEDINRYDVPIHHQSTKTVRLSTPSIAIRGQHK